MEVETTYKENTQQLRPFFCPYCQNKHMFKCDTGYQPVVDRMCPKTKKELKINVLNKKRIYKVGYKFLEGSDKAKQDKQYQQKYYQKIKENREKAKLFDQLL
jgi:hypothetical protein